MQSKRYVFGVLALGVLVCLAAATAYAQNPTGTLRGKVIDDLGKDLPGVTVSITSEALPGGSQVAVTSSTGDYVFHFLPPGTYNVMFTMDGFHTNAAEVKISAPQTRVVDAELQPATVTEEIVVTGQYETVSATSESATTFDSDLMETLAAGRTLTDAVLLTAGTADTGPSNRVSISGSQSWENTYLVNGVNIQDNVRYTPTDLYIEDAIEETTTMTSGVTSEYGRFAGGVVNMVTKSGGNQFSGSFRASLTNDDWEAKTPKTTEQVDEIDPVYEATFGGYILKDRLWFFLAGRQREDTQSDQLYDLTPFEYGLEEDRYEGKLTFSPHVSHRIMASYMDREVVETNYTFRRAIEPSAIDAERNLPYSLLALNYTGVLTDRFFVEAQYSEKKMSFENAGGSAEPGDRINGTEVYYYYENASAGSATFCGSCGPEKRDNEDLLLKGSYFLSTNSVGTHDLVVGYDRYTDIRLSNNYQTPSNFRMYNYTSVEEVNPVTGETMSQYGPDGTFYPVFAGYIELDFWPVLKESQGTDFITNSFYVNDTWRLNKKLTFNIGVRYDANDGTDSAGKTVADDSRWAPRLGATWDVKGDGEWLINASVSRYVSVLANSIADTSGGGVPSWFGYEYLGPEINIDENGVYTHEYTTPEAMAIVFDWFDSVGGLGNTDLWYDSPAIRGVNRLVEGLQTPYTDEYSIGFIKRFGNRGLLRADYVHREAHDFFLTQVDLSTGQVTWVGEPIPGIELEEEFDLGYVINNDDEYRRDYDGLHTSFQYRLGDRWNLGATWTWSHAIGNFNGETSGSGPVTGGALYYPEYNQAAWDRPIGDLAIDQRHKVRAWAVWDLISSAHHNLSISWMENFWSGQPYGTMGTVLVNYPGRDDIWFPNPGYLNAPFWGDYWFENRDAYRTDDIHRSDLSVNYSFFLNAFGGQLEMYVQPQVVNLFNEQGVIDVKDGANTWRNADYELFDPFTEAPERGVHWDYVTGFGEPENEEDYQTPRTFRVSLGIRF